MEGLIPRINYQNFSVSWFNWKINHLFTHQKQQIFLNKQNPLDKLVPALWQSANNNITLCRPEIPYRTRASRIWMKQKIDGKISDNCVLTRFSTKVSSPWCFKRASVGIASSGPSVGRSLKFSPRVKSFFVTCLFRRVKFQCKIE